MKPTTATTTESLQQQELDSQALKFRELPNGVSLSGEGVEEELAWLCTAILAKVRLNATLTEKANALLDRIQTEPIFRASFENKLALLERENRFGFAELDAEDASEIRRFISHL
ncbi:MAG: hypothetical protein GC165_07540 [Armatimonadetes bacterium]|nr:hypothetical protein [Armatimonadota bacterium]